MVNVLRNLTGLNRKNKWSIIKKFAFSNFLSNNYYHKKRIYIVKLRIPIS